MVKGQTWVEVGYMHIAGLGLANFALGPECITIVHFTER
jgi:hypothetical protein